VRKKEDDRQRFAAYVAALTLASTRHMLNKRNDVGTPA